MLIFQKMLTLFFLMAVGYFMRIRGWITDENSGLLSKIVNNIANPAMIIAAAMTAGDAISNQILLITALLAVVFYALLTATGPLITRLLHVPAGSRGCYKCMHIFGNIGFMGIPLITSIYGSEYALLVAIYNFVFLMLLYTYGIRLCRTDARALAAADGNAEESEEAPFSWKNLVNAGTVGCIIALVIFLTRVPMPDFITNTFDMLDGLAGPLAMFAIGSSLAAIAPKELVSDMRLNLFILIRLIAIPIAAIAVFRLFCQADLLLRVFYVMISVPIASSCVLMPEEYGGNCDLAARGVALSTLLSVITLPLVGMIFGL